MIGSPNNIEVLLHYHCFPKPHERADAPAVHDATQKFLKAGAIEWDEDSSIYRTTPLGRAWVEALCRVPAPKSVFVDEQGRVI